MALLKKSNPWNPGYSLPQNVRDEPFGQGVLTTGYTPRGTISALQPDQFTAGDSITEEAIDAARNAGVMGTLAGKHSLSGLSGMGSLGGSVFNRTSLAGPTLATKKETTPIKVSATDPIGQFGIKAAKVVLGEMRAVPKESRIEAMRTLLDAIDPSLWAKTAAKADALRAQKGYSAEVALEKALAIAFADRLVYQYQKLATERSVVGGLLGLTDIGTQRQVLGGFWSSIGSKISGGASSAYNAAKSALGKVGSLVCKASNTPGVAMAATAAGGPAGGAGAAAAGVLCTKDGGAAATDVSPPASSTPSWLVPAAIGGGALVLILALKK